LVVAEEHVDGEVDTQVLTDEILEGEHIVDEGEHIVDEGEHVDLETHTIIDEHGNHQLVTGENLQDLITLHSVDADGNIVTNEHPIGDDEHLVDGMVGLTRRICG